MSKKRCQWILDGPHIQSAYTLRVSEANAECRIPEAAGAQDRRFISRFPA
jgi:hypothetical protein